MRLLSVRPRSRHELASRLRTAGFERAEVQEELERLEAVGLVDDESFARAVAEHQVKARRAGRRAIFAALAAKGVDRRTIEETLASLGGDEEGRAEALAGERARALANLPREKAYLRLVGLLQRRGFDGSVARSAARAALEQASQEAGRAGSRTTPCLAPKDAVGSVREVPSDRSSSNRA